MGKANIAGLLLQKPLPYVSEGGPSGLSKALSTGRDIAGVLSIMGGLSTGGLAGAVTATGKTGTEKTTGGGIKLPSDY